MFKKRIALLLTVGLMIVLLPAMAAGLEVGIVGNIGAAGGTTDNKDVTGQLGLTYGGGLTVSHYFVDLGGVRLGASTGLEYKLLNYIYEEPDIEVFPTVFAKLSVDPAVYTYLVIPVTVKAAFDLSNSLALAVELGVSIGIFLGGESESSFGPPVNSSATTDLEDENTPATDIGLRGKVGLDIEVIPNLLITPGILFDFGLTDITKDFTGNPRAKARDTLWAADGFVAVSYKLL
jgi:hypothetical protein